MNICILSFYVFTFQNKMIPCLTTLPYLIAIQTFSSACQNDCRLLSTEVMVETNGNSNQWLVKTGANSNYKSWYTHCNCMLLLYVKIHWKHQNKIKYLIFDWDLRIEHNYIHTDPNIWRFPPEYCRCNTIEHAKLTQISELGYLTPTPLNIEVYSLFDPRIYVLFILISG